MSETEKALEALGEIENCISSILSLAHKNGVTALSKFKFKEQLKTIRTALQQPEVVSVEELGKDIERWRFNDDIGGKFGDYLAKKYPNGIIIKGDK